MLFWDQIVAFVTKWAVLIVGGLLIIAALIVAWLWHDHNVRKNAVAPIQAQEKVDKARDQSAHDAVTTVEKNSQSSNKTDETTRKNHELITGKPGAGMGLDPSLDSAGRTAVCMRPSASHLPECQSVLHPRSK